MRLILPAAVLAMLPAFANAQFKPAAGSPFTLASQPYSVATGDFNGDGIPDLATANFNDNSLTVLLGNKSGGYTPAAGSPIPVGTGPQFVAVRDFNGDGRMDLLVVNFNSNNVTVLLGNGSGSFTGAAGGPITVGTNPFAAIVGDFNEDGKWDLATSNSTTDDVTVLLGDGSGGFTAAPGSPFKVGLAPFGIAVADFNADGHTDIVTANFYSDNITILTGDGKGGFGAARSFVAGSQPFDVTVGDFNGDGKKDLAVANEMGNTVTLLLGDGKGAFTQSDGSPIGVGTSPRSVVSADFNGDGNPDLAVANNSTNDVTLLLGDGTGRFNAASGSPFTVGLNPRSMIVADFNGDGRPDVAMANSSGASVTVLVNSYPAITANPVSMALTAGAGQASPVAIPVAVGSTTAGSSYSVKSNQPWLTSNPASNATGGLTSVAVSANQSSLKAGTYSGTIRYAAPNFFDAATNVTLNVANPSGTLAADLGSPLAAGGNPSSVAVGDFNGDGKQDFVSANSATGDVSVLLGDGAGGFTAVAGSPFAVESGPVSIALGDFNGDGNPDLATVTGRSPNVTVLLGDGKGGFRAAAGSLFPVGPGTGPPSSVAVGDLNGDGIPDLVTADSNSVGVLFGNGIGGFAPSPQSPFPNGVSPLFAVIGDFNGDGRPDIAAANNTSSTVSVLLADGSGGFSPAQGSPFTVGSRPQSVVVADFNGDGKLDFAAAGGTTVTIMLGDGAGGFAPAAGGPIAAGSNLVSAVSGDFNGDGKLDLAIANQGNASVSVLLGNGAGGFSPPVALGLPPGVSPTALAVGDFNGDGRVDLVAANGAANSVTVWQGSLNNSRSSLSTTAGSTVVFGQSVPLSLAVADLETAFFNTPTGTAAFFDGTTLLGTASQTTGPYTFNTSGLATGSHTLTAAYSGDIRTTGSSSNAITIQVGPASGPTIANVQNAATFQTTLAPNTYAAIFGQNLSTTNPGRSWGAADFTTNPDGTLNLPASLDGTTVTVGGAAAFISYVSPGQINIVTPPNVTGVNIPVVVKVNGQVSATFNVTIVSLAPSFFAWQPGTADNGKYLVAQHADYTNVGRVGLFPGLDAAFTTPAKPGDTIMLYGTGFGPTSPPIAPGIETDKVYSLSPTPAATLGGLPATVAFAGLIPPLSQIYQFNVTIPVGTPDGDQALIVNVGGTASFAGLITIRQ